MTTNENPEIVGTFIIEKIDGLCYKLLVVEKVECEEFYGWLPIHSAESGPIQVIGGKVTPERGKSYDCSEATKVEHFPPDSETLISEFYVMDTCFYEVKVTNPTHWRPLPAPPKP